MNKEETKQQLKDIEELMIHVDKPYRIEALHALHKQVVPLNFWTVFHRWWNTIENPSDYIDHINDMFEYDEWGYNYDMLQDQSRLHTLEKVDRDFFDSLPDEFAVFRGCHGFNEQGCSWSTDRKVAEKFALRMAIDKQYILLQGMVRKTDIICAYNNRQEKEIVVLPKKVIIVGRERANDPILRGEEFKKFSDTSNVYHMVQTGRYRQTMSKEDLRSMAESHWMFDITYEGVNCVRRYVMWFEELISLIAKNDLDTFSPLWFTNAHDRYITGKDILEGDPRGVVKQAEQLKASRQKLNDMDALVDEIKTAEDISKTKQLMNGCKPATNAELDDIIDSAMRQAEENNAKKK